MILYDLPEAEYHARPELSSTGARMLLPQYKGSPKKFLWAQTHPRTSRAFDVGHAAHSKILGVGDGTVLYPEEHLTPSGNVSTKAATVAWEDEQRAAGLIPVSPGEAGRVDAMAEAVLAHDTARPLLEIAEFREVSIFADVDGVPCRARLDALSGETRNGIYGLDLKTTDDATPAGFTRSVHRHGYDVQDGFYEDVYQASTGRPIDQFWFLCVEKSGPYEVGVFQLEPFWVAMGKTKAAEARRLYKEATDSGVWRGYEITDTPLSPPAYAVIEHELDFEYGEINV